MIDRIQANQLAMLRTLLAYMLKQPDVLADITMLQTLTDELSAGIGRIDSAAAGASSTIGVTVNKETARRMATSFAVPICLRR